MDLLTEYFCRYFEVEITDGQYFVCNSVGNYRRKVSVSTYRLNYGRKSFHRKKKGGSLTWRFWRVIFSDGITDGFKKTARTTIVVYIADGITDGFEMADPYGDVSNVLLESSTVSPMECPSVKPSGKVNICPIYRPFPLLFLLLPNPNSPHLQTTSPPPLQTKISLISAQQVIFLEVLWSQHPCSDLPMDFINFCK